MKKASKIKKDYIYSVGRRKTSSARVRIFKGSGQNSVNLMQFEKYFDTKFLQSICTMPLRTTDTSDKYYFTVKVVGGGKISQAKAVSLGIARSLSKISEDYKKLLRKSSLLTRDSRERLRRRVGTGGKARRKKQSPKR